MNETNFENTEIKDNIWIDEKEEREKSVKEFLRIFNYDGNFDPSELHFFGGYPDIVRSVKSGDAEISRLSCFYKNNEIEKIHIVFPSKISGQLNVYLLGSVLKEYLEKFNI